MKDNVRGIKGEYRELTPKEIGDFVRNTANFAERRGRAWPIRLARAKVSGAVGERRKDERGSLPEGSGRVRPAC